ncbi:hypothetical protein [Fischerella thermalis]|nr:hypothetical protein [Fischerella thermalis]
MTTYAAELKATAQAMIAPGKDLDQLPGKYHQPFIRFAILYR